MYFAVAGARGQEPVSVFISRKDAEALNTVLVITKKKRFRCGIASIVEVFV